ncbi:MAG: beta-ketoacyl-ACP synthase II [Bacteroidales bacterium]|nr:beta-ketoacyl-ACP synthase II [Bacteroidales bacterium]
MELKRVVVTGLGAITPIGKTVPEYWDGLKNGVSGAAPMTRFDTELFKTKFGCEVKDYNPTDYFDRKEARKLDLFTQFAIIAGTEAVLDSKLDLENINKDKAGVVWASGIGGISTLSEDVIEYANNGLVPRFNPFFIPKIINDIAAGHLSIKFDFRGPNFSTVSACASSSHAIIEAYHYIKLGKADIMLCGGSEAPLNPPSVGGFNSMHAISTRNDDPKTASRPFDVDRDGFVMAEGGAAIVIEEYEHAIKRGANIYCEIVGIGATADAHHITAPHPEGRGAAKVMEVALEEGGVKIEEVDYINVHGTSTPLGDIAEPLAILKVFGEHAYKLNISSTKSMVGHLLGGAGAVEAIATILSMKNNFVAPTINVFNRDPQIDPKLNLTENVGQHREINVAISNTFGFGGHNACIAFKKI